MYDRQEDFLVPQSCPLGFQGRYTVNPGDTMWSIAERFNVTLTDLINANPHITNPNFISPGDVLCVPGMVPVTKLPCCVILNPSLPGLSVDAKGVALISKLIQLRPGRTAIDISAFSLPTPSTFGNFDTYQGLAFIPGFITWQWKLDVTSPGIFAVWSGLFTEITEPLPPTTIIQVRPANTVTKQTGSAILTGRLANCNAS